MTGRESDSARRLEPALDELLRQSEVQSSEHWLNAEELELLSLAQELRQQLPIVPPSLAFQNTAKYRILKTLRTRRTQSGNRQVKSRPGMRLLRPVMVPISILLAAVLLLGSSGVASAGALPGDPLYAVKLGFEEIRLGLTLKDDSEATLLVDLADKRIEEAFTLANQGEIERVEVALNGYIAIMDRLTTLATESSEIDQQTIQGMSSAVSVQAEGLDQLLEQVGEAAVPALEEAKSKSTHGQEVLDYKEQGGSPSDLAPGQLKKTEEAEEGEEKGPKKEKTRKPKPNE